MKILFSLLAFCLFASCVHSQEAVDTVSVRVQYRALYKHTQEQKEAYDDITLLDIGRHSSRFYSQRFEQFLHLRDSVKSVNTDPMSYLQFLANTFGSKKGREYEVYKHIPQRGTLTYTDWKLGGLPGLILAASESRHEFSFVATGIEQMWQTATICFYPKRYLRSTPAKFQHLLEDYWKDQWNTTNRLQGSGYSEPPKAQRTFNACLMDKYE